MSQKRFAALIATVVLLGAAGLLGLYVTLGRMNTLLRSRGDSGRSSSVAPATTPVDSTALVGEGETMTLGKLKLTPVGRAQLQQELKSRQATAAVPPPKAPQPQPQAGPASAPPPAKPSSAPPT